MMTSLPIASITRTAVAGGAGEPAEVPRVAERADEDAGVGGVILHPDPVAEDGAAGEGARGVDGDHADRLARLAGSAAISRSVRVDLPAPGEPVIPIT